MIRQPQLAYRVARFERSENRVSSDRSASPGFRLRLNPGYFFRSPATTYANSVGFTYLRSAPLT